jgi:allantoinase
MSDLLLRSARLVFDGRVAPGAVLVRDGRIAAVGHGLSPDSRGELPAIDLGDRALMAGIVDAHVHVNEPGRSDWEGWESATRAAAAGGVTTLVDMPLNSIPVTTTEAALREKVASTEGKLFVDAAFWGGVVPGNAVELPGMIRAGVRGFKCFLCPSGIDDFPASTEDVLSEAMPVLKRGGVPLLVHAELESELRAAPADANPRAYLTYLHSRPKQSEDRALELVVRLVRETGCRAHIVHLSSASSIPILAAAKAEGLPISAETCPHYLCLTAEEVPEGDTAWKCSPPIRENANRAALWEALRDGTLDHVVTDHSPCVPGLKLFNTGDFMGAWGGIASLQLGLRAVWSEAGRRGFTLADLSRWMSRSTASLGRLHDRGELMVGRRADLVVFDPGAEGPIDPGTLLHRHPATPYAGRRLSGAVTDVWLAGRRIVEGGELVGAPSGHAILSDLKTVA